MQQKRQTFSITQLKMNEVHSRRGVGHEWKIVGSGENYSRLFGAGGHLDGSVALIQTFANKQKEDEVALHGNGDDTIDSNRYQRNMANANSEFNFSQYKSGAPYDEAKKGENFTVRNTDGLASGDNCLKIDPYSDVVDMTSQAVGALFGEVYKDTGTNDSQMGVNPFMHVSKNTGGDDAEYDDDMHAEVEDEDGYDIDYYYDEPYYDQKNAERQVQEDLNTGLRRINMKTTQGRQLQKVATKKDIMDAYQSVNDQYATTMQQYMRGTMLNVDEKKQRRDMIRQPLSKYQTSQYGVGDVSRSMSKKYKTKVGEGTTKLNAILVGV